MSMLRSIFILVCLGLLSYAAYQYYPTVDAAISHFTAEQRRSSPPPVVRNYKSSRVCDDAWEHELRPEPNVDHFDVTLHEGCFSGTIYLPARFFDSIGSGEFHWQPLDSTPDWWVALWFQHTDWPPEGPYGPSELKSYTYKPGAFRLQGHGRVRFFTNNPPLAFPERNRTPQ